MVTGRRDHGSRRPASPGAMPQPMTVKTSDFIERSGHSFSSSLIAARPKAVASRDLRIREICVICG
jgi:hypothetical protein